MIGISIISAISWLLHLIPQPFHPDLFEEPHLFSQLGYFGIDITSFVIESPKASLWPALRIPFFFTTGIRDKDFYLCATV